MTRKIVSLLLTLTLLAACDQSPKPTEQPPASAPAAAVPTVTLAQVRDALAQRNYGQAASMADQLTATTPADIEAWFVAAEAKAASDNRLAALAALEQSLGKGMRDLPRIESSPYLAAIRSSAEYHALLERFGLIKTVARAGEASVENRGSTTVVRAGDVSVTLPD